MALIHERIADFIRPTIESLGYQLWGVEVTNGKHQTVIVYIDKPEGIVIEDCEVVSDAISPIFDVEDPIESDYDLEVSSPGLDRKLFTLEQYQQFIDTPVIIHLRMAQENKRKWTGKIVGVTENSVLIDTSYVKPKPGKKAKPGKGAVKAGKVKEEAADPVMEILFANIMRANLDPVIEVI